MKKVDGFRVLEWGMATIFIAIVLIMCFWKPKDYIKFSESTKLSSKKQMLYSELEYVEKSLNGYVYRLSGNDIVDGKLITLSRLYRGGRGHLYETEVEVVHAKNHICSNRGYIIEIPTLNVYTYQIEGIFGDTYNRRGLSAMESQFKVDLIEDLYRLYESLYDNRYIPVLALCISILILVIGRRVFYMFISLRKSCQHA